MKIRNIPLKDLHEADWNPNTMSEAMLARLEASLQRYGPVENLVVRPLEDGAYEVVSGNQRLRMLKELGHTHAPCLTLDLDDAQARLLSQAMNYIRGQDDLGLRAELIREVLSKIPREEVLALLPETANSLKALASLGQQDMASYIRAWQQAQGARLKHLTFQLTQEELALVEEALDKAAREVKGLKGDNPNPHGRALALICRFYLQQGGIV